MLTLIELQKRMQPSVEKAVIKTIAMNSDLLANLPFQTITNNALKYNVEQTLPSAAFRGVNEGFTESTGIINPVTESLTICGGEIDVDTFLVDTGGQEERALQEEMKIKALAHNVGNAMVKGDSDTDPRSLDGIQKRCFGTQLVESQNTPSDAGHVITWTKLSEVRDKTTMATHWLMTQAHVRALEAGLRAGSGAGSNTFIWEKDEFGRRLSVFAGLPILIADRNEDLFASIGFNELGASGATANKSSIYCLSLRLGGFQGIQFSQPVVTDLGQLESKPSFRTRIQWYPGIALKEPRCVTRYRGIITGTPIETPAT